MPTQAVSKLHHCVYFIQFHLVLVTKYRGRVLTSDMLRRLRAIFQGLAEDWGIQVLEFNGEPDHVHLLLSVSPTIQPSVLVNNFKTVSSRYLRKEFVSHVQRYYRKPMFWSRTYCLLSCGVAPLAALKQYIQQQAGSA